MYSKKANPDPKNVLLVKSLLLRAISEQELTAFSGSEIGNLTQAFFRSLVEAAGDSSFISEGPGAMQGFEPTGSKDLATITGEGRQSGGGWAQPPEYDENETEVQYPNEWVAEDVFRISTDSWFDNLKSQAPQAWNPVIREPRFKQKFGAWLRENSKNRLLQAMVAKAAQGLIDQESWDEAAQEAISGAELAITSPGLQDIEWGPGKAKKVNVELGGVVITQHGIAIPVKTTIQVELGSATGLIDYDAGFDPGDSGRFARVRSAAIRLASTTKNPALRAALLRELTADSMNGPNDASRREPEGRD